MKHKFTPRPKEAANRSPHCRICGKKRTTIIAYKQGKLTVHVPAHD